MGLYADDAVFYSPDANPVSGRPAIRSLFDMVMKTYDADIQLRSTGLAVSDTLAYDGGDYVEVLTNRQTKAKANLRGSYLMVVRRAPDGPWRIVEHMWTQAPPVVQ